MQLNISKCNGHTTMASSYLRKKGGAEELLIFTMNKFIDEDMLDIKLHSPNDRMLKQPTFHWHYSM